MDSIANMKVEDLLYFFTSMFITFTSLGSYTYDMSMPKTGTVIVQTGGLIYGYMTFPLVVYSVFELINISPTTNVIAFTARNAFEVYFIVYTLLFSVFTYIFLFG